MSNSELLGLIAGIFLIGGYIPYVYEVIKKTDIPSRASWFIWSLSTGLLLLGVKGTGTTEAIWVPIADALGCFVIFILSIKYGVGGWTRVDKISFAICAASLLIWWITGDAFIALIMNLLVYISGYISTIKKALDDSKSESLIAWSFFFVGVILNFITVLIGSDKGLSVWLYPSVLVLVVGMLFAILLKGSKHRVL